MECSNVQDERPSCSASGGQSGAGSGKDVEVDVAEVGATAALGLLDFSLAMANHDDTDVQVRQLVWWRAWISC